LDSAYCAYHTRQQSAQPAPPLGEASQGGGQQTDPIAATAPTRSERKQGIPVGDVRAQLARDTADEYELLRSALLDALRAEREAFVTCPNCQKRHPVVVPDWTARVKAVETLLNQGFGVKPETAAEHTFDRRLRELSELYDELTEEERTALDIAMSARSIENGLRSHADLAHKRHREGKSTSPTGTANDPQPYRFDACRERLRRFLIELFQLDGDQQALFHRLLVASPRIWSFVDELREQIVAHRNER
jgi:hypothetical protein